jgi:hypothetical protein
MTSLLIKFRQFVKRNILGWQPRFSGLAGFASSRTSIPGVSPFSFEGIISPVFPLTRLAFEDYN